MTSIYATERTPLRQLLTNLLGCLDKAEAYAAERKFDPNVLVTSRLAPDMHPLSFQIQTATDHVKGSLSRLDRARDSVVARWREDHRRAQGAHAEGDRLSRRRSRKPISKAATRRP